MKSDFWLHDKFIIAPTGFSSLMVKNWHRSEQIGFWIIICPCIEGCGSIVGFLKGQEHTFPFFRSTKDSDPFPFFSFVSVNFTKFVSLIQLKVES